MKGITCITIDELLRNHALAEEDGKMNPLLKNEVESMRLLERLRVACAGAGIKGRVYRWITRLIPFGIKVYGKYNEIEFIAVPGAYEFIEPSLYASL
jgi:hypothetical protein